MEPNEMEQLWRSYLENERRGLRPTALDELRRFTALLDADPVLRDEWARELLRRREREGNRPYPIRTLLFQKVIFPFLAEQYKAGDPDAPVWLVRLYQLLTHSRTCWEALGRPGSATLWREAYRRNTNNEEARRALIAEIVSNVQYTLHELPQGVLFGVDGATQEECTVLEADLAELPTLLRSNEVEHYDALIREAEFHYRAYREYLNDNRGHKNYESFFKSLGIA